MDAVFNGKSRTFYIDLHQKMIVIVQSGDLMVTIIEHHDTLMGNERTLQIRQTATFRVRREILSKSSPVFERMLDSGDFKETSSDTVQLEGDHVTSMEIWFRAIHQTVDPLYKAPLDEMWHVIAAGDKYDLDIKVLRTWFANWYHAGCYALYPAEKLLYPCYTFDHAKGFMYASKRLVYESIGHITENNPTKLYELHMQPRIMQQLNAAKGRLKSILHRDLFKPVEPLLRSGDCAHVKDNVFGYFKELLLLGAWPVEDATRTDSMNDILAKLENFGYSPSAQCNSCSRDYKKIVKHVREKTEKCFDGLCLDCLDKTKPRTGDSDIDYWKYQDFKEDSWIKGCRILHKQPTWYFSYMGRKADRELFLKRHRSSRET